MHETFDHTADLGLRIRAASLDALFAEAGQCLFEAIVENFESILPARESTIVIPGQDREYLLFDWLRELLYRFDAEQMLFREFRVRVGEQGLQATVRGELVDAGRHLLSHEVKAITYHGLKVEKDGDAWLAEVIVDI